MMPGWVGQYIGVPYEETDCWELIRRVYAEQFHIVLPPAPGGSASKLGAALWQQEVNQWLVVSQEDAQLGDILAFHFRHLGWHAGLVIAPGLMLHSSEGVDSAWETYERPEWLNHCAGVYRHPRRQAANDPTHRLSAAL